MKFNRAKALLVAASVACLVTLASAQVPRPLGVTIKAGMFFPTSSPAKALGKQWFMAGAEMNLFRLNLGPVGSEFTLSIDNQSKSGASSTPILVNYVARVDKLRFTVGAGISFADRPGFDNSVKFAYAVGAGYEFPLAATTFIAELRWFSVADVSSHLDGFGLTLGVRL